MPPKHIYKLLISSARQVVQVVNNGERILKGQQMNNVALINGKEGNGVSIVVCRDGLIHGIGLDDEIQEKYKDAEFEDRIDASEQCVLPGFVDPHTHPVWAGDRVNEFSMKLAGASYLDIHNIGGGIYYTVEQTQKATETELLSLLTARFAAMLKGGITLVEAKSGYGLDVESEIKLLKVIEKAKLNVPIDISTTFCGAHAIPRGMKSQEATEAIIREHLPKIKELMDAGELNVDSIDVFCEAGVFDVEQACDILKAGRSCGLMLNFHGEELHTLGSAEMGANLGAEAISHLERVSSAGIEAMAKAGTVAVMLPSTAYVLRLQPPPVREMIEAGVAVALGTDFNPNAFCISMPHIMNLACVQYGMTMAEALTASTVNAAAALGRSATHGSIEIGKLADMIVINAPRWEYIIYEMGAHDILIQQVIKNGTVVYRNMSVTKLI